LKGIILERVGLKSLRHSCFLGNGMSLYIYSEVLCTIRDMGYEFPVGIAP